MKKFIVVLMVVIVLVGCSDKVGYEVEYTTVEDGKEVTTNNTNGEITVNEKQIEEETPEEVAAKIIVDKYYEFWKEGNANKVAALLSEGLVEKVGGLDRATEFLAIRMNMIGDITDYEIVSTEKVTSDDSGKKGVGVVIKTTYSTSQVAEEKMIIADGTKLITTLDLPEETNSKIIIEEYFKSVGDAQSMKSHFVPYGLGQIDQENFDKVASLYAEVLGDYKDYEIIEDSYLSTSVEGTDFTCHYVVEKVIANYENMSIVGRIQVGREKDIVGINFTNIYPQPLVSFYENYMNMVKSDDVDGLMTLFAENYYKQVGMTTEQWRPNMEYIVGDMSENVEYRLVEWDYMLMPLSDGTQMPILGLIVNVDYNGKLFKEQFIINYDDNTPMIQSYKIEPLQ